MYTDIQVVIDPSLTVPGSVCGEVVRADNGVALRIVLCEHITVKSVAELPAALREKTNEAKMVKRFIFLVSTA